jgi:UrcA family protein
MNRTNVSGRSPRIWIGALAALCVGSALPSAFANNQPDPPNSIRIKYADLDLSQPAGAEALYLRIQRAARTVCAWDVEAWDGLRVKHERECNEDTVAKAVKQVHNANLTAMYREHSKDSSVG